MLNEKKICFILGLGLAAVINARVLFVKGDELAIFCVPAVPHSLYNT